MKLDGIELRHLRYFAAVADELHFGRAAARLGMAQPPLSQAIRRLEARLGYSLFVRHTRGAALTASGQVLLDRVRKTIAKFEQDLDIAGRVARGEVGSLTVGFAGSAMLTSLPAALRDYRRQYPDVDLRLREMVTSALLDALREGNIDVALLRDPGPCPDLALQSIWSENFVAVLPARHKLAACNRVSLAALSSDPFVLFSRAMGPEAFDRTLALCQAAGFTPRIVQEAPHWLTVVRLVGAGFGVSLAPACVGSLAARGVTCKSLRGSAFRTEVVLGYNREKTESNVTAFAQVVRRVFQP